MCPKIRGVRCPCDVRCFLRWTADRGLRGTISISGALFLGDHDTLWSGEELAGEEGFEPRSVIQSQLPESGPADAVLNGDQVLSSVLFPALDASRGNADFWIVRRVKAAVLLGVLLVAGCSSALTPDQQVWCAANGERVTAAREAVRAGKLGGLPVGGRRLTKKRSLALLPMATRTRRPD